MLRDPLAESMEKLSVSDGEVPRVSMEEKLLQIADDMQKYMAEVDHESERLAPFITDTVKAIIDSLKPA